MKLNLSLKLRNILLMITFLSICFLCDAHFFSNIILTLFPYFTCSFEQTLGYHLYQTSEIYRIIYNNREITTCVLGCLYFLFFRCYVFQKWVFIIENKCQGLFLHDFLKELRKNKQILLYANIIFLLLTIEMFHFYAHVLKINYLFSFMLFFPFHYIILYVRWVIKDKNFKNKHGITNKYPLFQYINYIVAANALIILFSSFYIFLGIFCAEFLLNQILYFALFLLAVIYIIYFIHYSIQQNTKLFLIIYLLVFLWIFLFIYCFFNESYEKYLTILITPFIVVIEILFLIGIISSLFINQVAKLLTDKNMNN